MAIYNMPKPQPGTLKQRPSYNTKPTPPATTNPVSATTNPVSAPAPKPQQSPHVPRLLGTQSNPFFSQTMGPSQGGGFSAPAPRPMRPPQSIQPTGNRFGMSGSFGAPQQTTQPIGGRMGMSGSFGPPPQTVQPVGQRIGGSMSGGGALAEALGRRQANSQQSRPNDNRSILMQMLR